MSETSRRCTTSHAREGDASTISLSVASWKRATLGFACALLLVPGCSRESEPSSSDESLLASTQTSARTASPEDTRKEIVHSATDRFARAINAGVRTGMVAEGVGSFASSLNGLRALDMLLTAPSKEQFNYACVSNLVSNVSTRDLMNRVVREYTNRQRTSPKEVAIMLLFEVVMNRKGSPSASMYARSQMADYYMFHGSFDTFPGRGAEWAAELLRNAELSENANKYEKGTYASIQLALNSYLVYNDPNEGLVQIAKIEEMAQKGDIPFPEQPIQILPLFKACALLALNREAEARQVVQELYDRLDTIDDEIIQGEFTKGVDWWINNHKASFLDLYPEMEGWMPE